MSKPPSIPSAIRRLAFQMLFQMDAVRASGNTDGVLGLEMFDEDPPAGMGDREHRRAAELALGAYGARDAADHDLESLAPDWPPRRQPAVDRAILRLAHYEITTARVPARVAIDEAVELAKVFGTDRSPAFINAVLDALAKRAGANSEAAATE